ncbi:hypothetical protein P7C71_g1785, partial [Lecanoromycetidae sp. Uapishka_2]
MSGRDEPKNIAQRRANRLEPDTLPREKLPTNLQKLVDNEESLLDQMYDGTAGQSTDSSLRYAAYASRARTILLSAHRYVAYTSDIGESFRPLAHPWLVKGAYGVSWAYLVGDLGLAAVPFLPFMFDKPIEEAVEWSFHKGFEIFGGPDAVAHQSEVGRTTRLLEESKKGASKEKEL